MSTRRPDGERVRKRETERRVGDVDDFSVAVARVAQERRVTRKMAEQLRVGPRTAVTNNNDKHTNILISTSRDSHGCHSSQAGVDRCFWQLQKSAVASNMRTTRSISGRGPLTDTRVVKRFPNGKGYMGIVGLIVKRTAGGAIYSVNYEDGEYGEMDTRGRCS
jgi:hypothetical protein